MASGPRLLLFGSPGAGKSALLGALAQVASAQPALLKGTLTEESGALVELQKNTYETKLDSTDKLTKYGLRLQADEGGALPAEATVIDCSGAEAHEMLESRQPFVDSHPL